MLVYIFDASGQVVRTLDSRFSGSGLDHIVGHLQAT